MASANHETPSIEEMIAAIDRIVGPGGNRSFKIRKTRARSVAGDGTAVASVGLALVLGVAASAVLASRALRPEPAGPPALNTPRHAAPVYPIYAAILPHVPAYIPAELAPLPRIGIQTAHLVPQKPRAAMRPVIAEAHLAVRYPAAAAPPEQNGDIAEPLTGDTLRLARIEDAKLTRELNLQELRRVAGAASQ